MTNEGGLDLIVENEAWLKRSPTLEVLAKEVFEAASLKEPKLKPGAVALFADDDRLNALSLQFRDKDAPTNVLSFPSDLPPTEPLGDIAIAFETVEREANDLGRSFEDHTAHLIVHGLLHLAGYDHGNDDEAALMEGLETEILASINITDPYAIDAGDE